ncbi:retinitis pigmentosa 9 protein homolog [Oppia nitens]|uniref:retinitis pigmentosa 9 protein homolog n=1 Tax=Oppia nitens TaxID=1686743 RepID=UPI0023DCDD90|nr:retinitis pigmentosa 9 protein homolog [Oppia nitens]
MSSSNSSRNRRSHNRKDSRVDEDNNTKKTGFDSKLVEAIKHYNTFYEAPPPGFIKEEEERPEDCIPDLPENSAARDFLAHAPKKGLWMPLGKEVKVMKCWRCKTYGHRTGDKECPLFLSGNKESEQFRYIHEDPMYDYIKQNEDKEKQLSKVEQLKALLDEKSSTSSSSSDTNSSSTSSSSSSSSRHKKRKRSTHKKKRKSNHKSNHKKDNKRKQRRK